MPAIPYSVSYGCADGAGVLTLLTAGGGAPGSTYAFYIESQDSAFNDMAPFDPATDLPLSRLGLPDETLRYYVEATAPGGAVTRSLAHSQLISCAGTGSPGALSLDSVSATAVTSAGNDGTATIQASGGTAPLTATIAALSLSMPATAGSPATFTGRSAGSYLLRITDSTGAFVEGTAIVGAAPVAGCTDPDADNYDPLATAENGSCSYAPRVVLTQELPALVPNGVPVLVTLASPVIAGNVPAAADAFINVEELGAATGIELYVNGYRLVSGPVLLPTNFYDGPSLLDALQAIAPLVADYVIRLNQDQEVRLTARATGTPSNLEITTSDPALIGVVSVPGVNQYRSQLRAQWGCYLEVWVGAPETNPGTYSDLYEDAYRDRYGVIITPPSGPLLPVLAQRVELNYRADNAYTFDIAPALRQFTGHAYPQPDGSCPDRLCSYFLKFGELYATPTSIRRQRNAYLSATTWALDAVELVPEVAAGVRVLSRAPSLGMARNSPRGVLRSVLLDSSAEGDYNYGTYLTDWSGAVASAETPVPVGVSALHPDLLDDLLGNAGFDESIFQLTAGIVNNSSAVRTAVAVRVVETPGGTLTFANGQGGFDSHPFEGVREETGKYAEASYGTPTGTATRTATLPDAFRLTSGALTRAEYIWLRRELGNSPARWLETEEGPVAVRITAFTADADEVKAEYSLTVDCEPQIQPVLGLTN